jgi:thioredoxin 1
MSLTSISEQAFTQDVLESPTPVLVHFWAPWCGLCRLINPLLMRFQGEWGEQFKVVGFNADQSLKVANTYRLTTLPTLILFEGGKVQHRIDGFHGREDLWKSLETMASIYGESNKTLWLQPQQKRHPFSA